MEKEVGKEREKKNLASLRRNRVPKEVRCGHHTMGWRVRVLAMQKCHPQSLHILGFQYYFSVSEPLVVE